MFKDVLVIVQYLNEGSSQYSAWGFDGESNADILNQARIQADNNNSSSKLVKWVVDDIGAPGSFDHLIGKEPQ